MRIKELLNQRFSAAMQAAGVPSECSPTLALSGKPQFGDYQANGAMGAAKRLKMNPRDLAEKIIQHVDLDGIADKLEIAGPGFINIHLSNAFLTASLSTDTLYTKSESGSGRRPTKRGGGLLLTQSRQRNACGPSALDHYWRCSGSGS